MIISMNGIGKYIRGSIPRVSRVSTTSSIPRIVIIITIIIRE